MLKLLVSVLGLGCALGDWNYDYSDRVDGPRGWENTYPKCGGNMQSPINIKTKKVRYKDGDGLPNINWEPFVTDFVDDKGRVKETRDHTFVMENNGHFLELALKTNNEAAVLTEGPLNGRYSLAKVIFHWHRSEHEINGKRQEGEVQFVFERDQGNLDFCSEGVSTYEHGLAIYSVLLNKGDYSSEMEKIVDLLPTVTAVGATAEVDLDLFHFLPSNWKKNFYTYQGSMTYPPCDESVTWFIAERPIDVSSRQLKELRTLLAEDGGELTRSYRPAQKVRARSVFRSFSTTNSFSSNFNLLTNLLGF